MLMEKITRRLGSTRLLLRPRYVITWYAVAVLLWSSHPPFCSARDTITYDTPLISDGVGLGSETLVSAGGIFELGFFSLGEDRRYVGIWYHKLTPRTVVWVANRDNPVLANSRNALFRFAIKEGNLHVLDATGKSYWSTGLDKSKSLNQTVVLMDSGNLVLSNSSGIVWQSFQNPTDTFIPGMRMDTRLELTSGRSLDDPGRGNFTFKQDQVGQNQYIILKLKSIPYWKSGEAALDTSSSSDVMSSAAAYLLSNFSNGYIVKNSSNIFKSKNSSYAILPRSEYNYTRLVMNFTGELLFEIWPQDTKQWRVFWSAPRDPCSVLNACGNFGSCNNNNSPLVCKCLPGFKPSLREAWDAGDFSGGCTGNTSCGSNNDTFLSFKMMKVGNSDSQITANNETECRNECFKNCQCKAYSYSGAESYRNRGDAPTDSCWIWLSDLNTLQEESADGGRNLSVRIASSDLESTVRSCKPCGTTIIPYPLSTGPDCGDPMYFRFNCKTSTGQVSFVGLNGTFFRVIRISPSTRRFFIQGHTAKNDDNCDPRNRLKFQQLNASLPFMVINWCNADLGNFSSEVNSSRGPNVVEMGWERPLEPTCTTSAGCTDWPHSTCNTAKDGKKRCLCNTNFQWDSFKCTQEGNLQEHSRRLFKIIPAVFGSVIIFLVCIVCFYIWIRRKKTNTRDQISRAQFDSERRVKELIDTSEFKEEEGIDVPFFDFQSILDATDNFSNANKLGQGGYGPVYKGSLLGGQEIAVKRLSRVSGQGLQEFKNEVVLIAKLQHRNLVRLKGYCMKGEEKILLYEYLPNKSLDSFIFDDTKSMFLNWEMRFNIILGIARGLLYLHQDSRLRIIHRDLKTSNILLDEEMNPKISDFGLARIVGGKETESNTNTVVGTYGYMSPEYALDGTFSVKSDVFSFGVVLFEIISGKKNAGFYQSKQTFSLINYAWKLWTENKVLDLMDKNLDESSNESRFIKCVNVGLLCVQEDPGDRPTMSNIITMLDSETVVPPTPKQPAFLTRGGNNSITASSSSKPETFSEISTLQEGR